MRLWRKTAATRWMARRPRPDCPGSSQKTSRVVMQPLRRARFSSVAAPGPSLTPSEITTLSPPMGRAKVRRYSPVPIPDSRQGFASRRVSSHAGRKALACGSAEHGRTPWLNDAAAQTIEAGCRANGERNPAEADRVPSRVALRQPSTLCEESAKGARRHIRLPSALAGTPGRVG